VRLQIADLERSVSYYERVIGLTLISRDGAVAVLGAADNTPLVELHELKGATPVPRRGRLGLFHFAVLLPDRPSLGRFITHLGELDVYVGSADHYVSEALYLTDPDGLGIEVYADRPPATWNVAEGQVVMATEALDVRSLVEAAGDTRWAGAPAGTVIGHVHLHVNDIDEGASFYHGALGFDKIVWNYPGALFLSAGGYHHHLGTNTWAAGAPRPGPGDARLIDWDLVLPARSDVDAAAASLRAAGYTVTADDEAHRAADPWGTALRLVTG
jgi:catechol 2,3-dioxygenase